MLVAFEIVTFLAIVVVVLSQRPGIKNQRYAAKRRISDRNRRRLEVAKEAEREFWNEHPMAEKIMSHGQGLILFAVGFGFVIVSYPGGFATAQWSNDFGLAVGLVIQAVATIWFVVAGAAAARRIRASIRNEHSG